ncbi:succinate dehydrogenase hydrophobic membrane anchor subunit [Cellvibrio zantedeschiae]|uniref:Succinate dehydrogenase hydrophobic membrane anchor subunit n=1 Tax=Cellvibrio zantedeschiae TaxID=1237077 RepID=A0ABQ3AX20_9GAMM|nr:succinate dehydrogenase, hydrophobic membrane anchor protein [Cellvibrio zantedeschiae]GGY66597.1 succinate dehydrogenase hydrophobic membrane anchor subunit [Cellvibrio zantedeschiae]
MVTSVTSFGRSGLYDWLIQRIGGVVMAAYLIFIVAFIAMNPELTYEQWSALHGQLWMRVFSFATLLSFIAHAWIGLWVVLTDYLTERLMGSKATVLRILAQVVLGGVSLTYLVWGIEILWGFK